MSLKVKVLSFGRSKQDIYSGEVDRFVKMCRSWGKVEFIVLKPVEAGNESVESALKKEAALLQKHWSDNAVIVSLGEEGKMMDSSSFVKYIKKAENNGREIIFNIGSAYGLSEDVKSKSQLILSLSPMTFPYKLCRLIFAEQIYRALAISNNHPYHKE